MTVVVVLISRLKSRRMWLDVSTQAWTSQAWNATVGVMRRLPTVEIGRKGTSWINNRPTCKARNWGVNNRELAVVGFVDRPYNGRPISRPTLPFSRSALYHWLTATNIRWERHTCQNNLSKVVIRQRNGWESNPRLCKRKSDALIAFIPPGHQIMWCVVYVTRDLLCKERFAFNNYVIALGYLVGARIVTEMRMLTSTIYWRNRRQAKSEQINNEWQRKRWALVWSPYRCEPALWCSVRTPSTAS